MFCAISNTTPEVPVVSSKSGHLFEKSLIEKALESSGGRCPVTGELLAASDLLPLKVPAQLCRTAPSPRCLPPPTASLQSLPTALRALPSYHLNAPAPPPLPPADPAAAAAAAAAAADRPRLPGGRLGQAAAGGGHLHPRDALALPE